MKIKIPVLLFVLLLVGFWRVAIPVMVVMLFFGCHYSFYGKDELAEANNIMNKASDIAEQVKEEFKK